MGRPVVTLTGRTRSKRVLLKPWKKVTLYEISSKSWKYTIWRKKEHLYLNAFWYPDNRTEIVTE